MNNSKKPSVTVDILVFTVKNGILKLLLIKRGKPPFEGMMAIPGGFVEFDESLKDAAKRELFEETNVKGIHIEQFHTFGEPKRDPRTRVISVAYIALINSEKIKLLAKTDAKDAQWVSIKNIPDKMAFDHKKIIEKGLKYLQNKMQNELTIAFQLLPENFTLTELQNVYEKVLDTKIDKRNFRKKILSMDILKEVPMKREGAHRPAQMYTFKTKEILIS